MLLVNSQKLSDVECRKKYSQCCVTIYYLLLTFDHTIAESLSLEETSEGHWLNSLLKAMLSLKIEQVASGLF